MCLYAETSTARSVTPPKPTIVYTAPSLIQQNAPTTHAAGKGCMTLANNKPSRSPLQGLNLRCKHTSASTLSLSNISLIKRVHFTSYRGYMFSSYYMLSSFSCMLSTNMNYTCIRVYISCRCITFTAILIYYTNAIDIIDRETVFS